MHVRATLCISLALIAQSRTPSTSTADVVDAAAGYVAKYEQQLTSVVASETSRQEMLVRSPDPRTPAGRTMKSEMFFMFSPAEHEWMAVRDVNEVDGKPVENPPDLKNALATVPLLKVARTLKAYSSRYNIGRIQRNFGEPTLSLLVLDANHRENFGFAATRTEQKSGATLVTLYFRERGSQTLLHDLDGTPVPSEGELVVEAGSGRIRQAVLRARLGVVQAELATTYQLDPKLELWVPVTFRERYEEYSYDGSTTRVTEGVRCEATYSNFRRFESFGRIK